jgi:hypothetical protein
MLSGIFPSQLDQSEYVHQLLLFLFGVEYVIRPVFSGGKIALGLIGRRLVSHFPHQWQQEKSASVGMME